MKSKFLLGVAFATTAACVAVIAGVNSKDVFVPVRTTATGDPITKVFTASDLANYTPEETGQYRLHPVTIGGKSDYSFRINLDNGKYINGLLLYGDCGNQTITNLSHFSMTKAIGGNDKDYFNFNIALCAKGLVSIGMQMTFTITGTNNYTSFLHTLNMTTSDSVITDEYIVDNYVGSLPANVSREANPYTEYVAGAESTFAEASYYREFRDELTKAANIATFRAGGYLTKDDSSANTVSVTVDYLEVRYNCN